MALTFTNVTTANSTASSSALTAASLTIAAGQWVLVAIAADNNGTNGAASLTGVTDSAGNTYTQLALNNQDPGAANEGTTLGIYLAKINAALSSGSISANFSPNTTSKAMSIKRISVDAGETLETFAVGAGFTGSGTAYSSGAVSVTNGYTIYGATALEQGSAAAADTDTTNGNWSTAHTAAASTGTNTTSQAITTQQKTVTATGNQTYDTSSGSTRDYALNYVIFRTAYSLAPDVGTFTLTGNTADTRHNVRTTGDTGKFFLPERNLLKWSEDLTNAAWSKTNSTITANAIAAPDGTVTADKVTENTATGGHRVAQLTATVGVSYAISFFAKAAERTRLQFSGAGFIGQGFTAQFNLSTGTMAANAGGLGAITAASDGWYRCTISAFTASTATTFQFELQDALGFISYTGDGTSGLYLWGLQVEQSSSAVTDYDPTGPAGATDAALRQAYRLDGGTGAFTLVGQPITIINTGVTKRYILIT